jgi:hypothetical protein
MKPAPPKMSRRRSLLAAGGIAVGAGLGTIVSEPVAQADDSKLTLKVYKRTAKGRVLVGAIDVPPEVADSIEGARDDMPVRFRLENDDEKGTVHADAPIAEDAKVKTALRRAKVRRKTAPSRR